MIRLSPREWLFLGISCVLMAAAALPWIGDLGMEYDECQFVETATRIVAGHPEAIPLPRGVYIDGRPFPFMTMPYVGALDGWLMAIPVGLFGFHPVVPRLVNLVAGFAVLFVAYLLGRRLGGQLAGAIAVSLLLVDLEWLLHVPVHYGPFLLQCFCAPLVWLLLDHWLEGGGPKYFYWACFSAGLGFQEKLTFAWIVVLTAIVFLVFRGRDVFRRLTPQRFATGLAIFLMAMLPVLIYAGGYPKVVFGFGGSSIQVPDWDAVLWRFHTFHQLLTGQEFMAQQLGEAGITRFSALEALFWASLVLSLILRLRPALMLALVTVSLVLLQAFHADGGRLHHHLLAYPLLQCAIGCAVASRRWTLLPAAALILATGVSTAHNLAWYSPEVRRTGGQGYWSSAIVDLAAWMRSEPDKVYTAATWGFYRPLYFLTGGRIAIHDRYFALREEQTNATDLEDVTRQVRRRGIYWLTSDIDPTFEGNRRRLFQIARDQGLVPRCVKEFRTRTGQPIYRVYSFRDEKAQPWRRLDVQAKGESWIELRFPPATTDVRFKLDGKGWRQAKSLTVDFLNADEKRVRAWWRSVEFFRLSRLNQHFEFGPDLYPDYFALLPGIEQGEVSKMTLWVDGKADLSVFDIEVR